MLKRVFSSLGSFLGITEKKKKRPRRRAKTPVIRAYPPEAEEAKDEAGVEPAGLSPQLRDFLLGLVSSYMPVDLQDMEKHDRLFLSGIIKMLGENRLDVPMLPRTAIEISRLLGDPMSSTADFVKILNSDPALSIGF